MVPQGNGSAVAPVVRTFINEEVRVAGTNLHVLQESHNVLFSTDTAWLISNDEVTVNIIPAFVHVIANALPDFISFLAAP